MISNTLTISQLIKVLADNLAQHGDLEVIVPLVAEQKILALGAANISTAIKLPWVDLKNVVLVLGVDHTPGAQATEYASDGDIADAGWLRDLDAAPERLRVAVYKRIGGRDEGFKGADGDWFVYEHGPRAWQVRQGGVMAWRHL